MILLLVKECWERLVGNAYTLNDTFLHCLKKILQKYIYLSSILNHGCVHQKRKPKGEKKWFKIQGLEKTRPWMFFFYTIQRIRKISRILHTHYTGLANSVTSQSPWKAAACSLVQKEKRNFWIDSIFNIKREHNLSLEWIINKPSVK